MISPCKMYICQQQYIIDIYHIIVVLYIYLFMYILYIHIFLYMCVCRGYRERVKCNIHTWLIFSYPACTLPDLTDCTLMPPHTFCTNKTHMQTHRYTKNPLHLNIKNDTRTKTEMFTEIWQYTMTIQWKKTHFSCLTTKS